MAKLAALISLLGVVWLGAWLGNIGPLGVDRGATVDRATAYAIDLALVALFGLQHSAMARPGWKRRMQGLGPERSVYLIATTLALVILFLAWRPIPATVWEASRVLVLGQVAGGLLAAWAVATLDARAFLGLRPQPAGLCTTGPYRWMRHPIMVGTVLVLWCVPRMSEGHLLFSTAMTLYAIIGTVLETKDLAETGPDLVH